MATTPFNKPSDLVRRVIAKRTAQAGGPPPFDDGSSDEEPYFPEPEDTTQLSDEANQANADEMMNFQVEKFRGLLNKGNKGAAYAVTQEFDWERDQTAEELMNWLES